MGYYSFRAALGAEPVKWRGGLWFLSEDGYYRNKKGVLLHRAVYEAEIGPIPEGYVVHHKDEDRGNWAADNLEALSWGEHQHRHELKALLLGLRRSIGRILSRLGSAESISYAFANSAASLTLRRECAPSFVASIARQQIAGSGIPSRANRLKSGVARSLASCVAKTFVPTIRERCAVRGAVDSSIALSVIGIRPLGILGAVYNLEVEEDHEYFANGLLVHNSWADPSTWDMLQFGLRLGKHPRVVIATTPRPTKLVRELLAREGRDLIVTRGTTYENRANLAPGFFDSIVSRYEGTRLGRQELNAEVLTDTPGALWTIDMIDRARRERAPDLVRVVVALDPAASSHEGSDESGVIVAGKDDKGHAYLLADLSGRFQPAEWAKVAISAYYRYGADRVIAETNNGGEMVENTLRMIDPNVSYSSVHASRGKFTRAEPCAALYEQGKIHHIGVFPELEDQMTRFTPDIDRGRHGSPDRLDAAVWAITELCVEKIPFAGLLQYYIEDTARMKRERGEVAAKPVATAEAEPELLPARQSASTAAAIVLPATLRCAPHRQFQASSGMRYEASAAGEIVVGTAADVADLLRSGCELA